MQLPVQLKNLIEKSKAQYGIIGEDEDILKKVIPILEDEDIIRLYDELCDEENNNLKIGNRPNFEKYREELEYILDLLMLICGIMLAEMMLVDLISFFVTGFAGLTLLRIVCCIFACASACGGGCGAIMLMRHLAVKTGFSGFAFYGWGLGLFSLILYLMV